MPENWSNLIALLDGRPDVDPITRAKRLCELCVTTTGVSGVALSITSNGLRSTVCATDALSDRLEELELTLSEGPVIDAVRDGADVRVNDLSDGSRSRWPVYAPAAIEAGALAVFALPVRVGAIRLGALSLYRNRAGSLSSDQFRDAHLLTEAAAVLLMLGGGSDTAEAFVWLVGDRSRFRAEVHQAVGATMVELGVEAKEAYARLGAYSFSTGRPIGDVAADIIAKRLRLERD